MSRLSGTTTNVKGEVSDANSIGYNPCCNKASKFKGVVALLNGHWGAQLYVNHQRIWLGTFKTENEAARAYDSAGIKLRNWDTHRNFPWTSNTAQEPNFQSQFSTEAVLCMIKDGSYPSKFADFLRLQCQSRESEVGPNFSPVHWKGEFLCTRLFEKELTPSDVGKLNRLVIPKKHAVSYFPCMRSGMKENEAGGEVDDVQLTFYDRSMRSWKFRYCYWQSSQSYVFTRGWNEFVREKQLKFKDRIIFYTYSYMDAANLVRKFCMIDVAYYDNRGVEEISNDFEGYVLLGKKEFEMEGVQNQAVKEQNNDDCMDEEEINNKADKCLVEFESVAAQNKGFKLFGVQIV